MSDYVEIPINQSDRDFLFAKPEVYYALGSITILLNLPKAVKFIVEFMIENNMMYRELQNLCEDSCHIHMKLLLVNGLHPPEMAALQLC